MSNSSFVRRSKAATIILGIVMLLLGLAFIIWPGWTTVTLAYICAWMFLIGGVVTIVSYIRQPEGARSVFDFVLGIAELAVGIALFFCSPLFTVYVLSIFLGCVIIVTGIADSADAVSMRKIDGSMWGLWLVLGILTIILGVLAVSAPFLFFEIAVLFAGWVLLFDGITEIIVGVRM